MLPLLTTPSFSPSLTHITAHPPALIAHIANSLSTPPPPLSSPERFWGVFVPFASRTYDVEELVYGNAGEGSGAADEMVVEVLVRGESADGTGRRKKGVERTLDGWIGPQNAVVELNDLASLKRIFTGRGSSEVCSSPPLHL